MHKGTINMTTGNVKRVIITFAVPVFLSQLFQQLYNTADSLIVGNELGKNALAAVSSSAAMLHLLTSLMMGISIGAGVVISRHFGAKDEKGVSDAIHTTVAFGFTAGIILTFVGIVFSPMLLDMMGVDSNVMDASISYFQKYFYGMIFAALYNCFMGIMNALGDSRRPLFYLMISSVLNILLDILFIGILKFKDVGWAAIATTISQATSAILCYLHLRKPGTIYQLKIKCVRFHPHLIGEVIRNGLPTGIQNSVISIANVMIQTHINSFGPDAMAACGAYSKLQGFAFLPITSFSMALTTFIGQNLGAGEHKRARAGARFGLISATAAAEVIGIIMVLTAPFLIRMFNAEQAVVTIGTQQSQIESGFFGLLAFSHAVSGVCRGAGKASVPMFVMLAVWCLLRIVYISVAMSIRHDITLLFWAYPITWCVSSVIFLFYYLNSGWEHSFDKLKHAH